jgi:hypothetical protein
VLLCSQHNSQTLHTKAAPHSQRPHKHELRACRATRTGKRGPRLTRTRTPRAPPQVLALLRTPRLLRLGKVARLYERLKNANVIRMVALLALMLLIAHWICCAWQILHASFRGAGGTRSWSLDAAAAGDVPTLYLQALYSALLLMLSNDVGPQNDIERAYCSVVLVLGACFYAIVVGNMSFLVTSMGPTAARHVQTRAIIAESAR